MSKHKIFSLPVRVYFQDTDAGGVVHHASYVNFFERARTEWLRTFDTLPTKSAVGGRRCDAATPAPVGSAAPCRGRTFGYSNAGLMNELGVMFVVRKLELNYLKPALLDDMLEVTAQIKEVGRSRVTLLQTVLRDGELLTEGEVHLVCVGADSFKPVSVPEVLCKQWKI